jgi:hypothetical protein
MENRLAVNRSRSGTSLMAQTHSKNYFAAPPDAGRNTRKPVLVRKIAHDRFQF